MSKENLKPNEINAPTIFIGVGGAGSEIVRLVAEMCQPEEMENINFVCLDTNVNDLMSVKKSKANMYYIQISNTQTVGDYLDYDEEARNDWFPKNAVMYDKTVSEGAGQVRAISRLALNSAIRTGKIYPLLAAIDDLFRKSGQDLHQALRMVIVSTASGGTGSGILLPLSMYVRDYVDNTYPDTGLITRALVLLPETLNSVISSTQEKESQRRNAYATIKEINAFMMKGSGFCDINEDLKRYDDMKVNIAMPSGDNKVLELLPMDFCFLLDGQDAEGTTMISFTQYKKQAAQALYEQNIGPMQQKAFSLEDNIIKELSDNVGRNRFGGIGSSILRYPYEELADYVAYNWALKNIGDEKEAGQWVRYDKAYKLKAAEEKKKGIPSTEASKLSTVYMDTLDKDEHPFSVDIRNKYLRDAGKKVKGFFTEFLNHIHEEVAKQKDISKHKQYASKLASPIDYSKEGTNEAGAANLAILRKYDKAVRNNAERVAESVAESIFYNETKAVNQDKPYTLEALLKNTYGETAHPVAARYLLYEVRNEMDSRLEEAERRLAQAKKRLHSFSSEEPNPDFDLRFTKETIEKTLEELSAAENENNKKSEKEELYAKYNEYYPPYHKAIKDYEKWIAEYVACQKGAHFLAEACKMYEKFFASFPGKVSALKRKKSDLIDSIAFVKGDSVKNICADKKVMDELLNAVDPQSSSGAMLDGDLNASIYDAVKDNVRFEREMSYMDVVEEDKRIDIFDQIVLEYFRQNVRRECADELDVNIVEAMALENRLNACINAQEEMAADEKVVSHVTREDNLWHIQECLKEGDNLAAPGIQKPRNEEPRDVNCVAYNSSLDDMQNYRMDEMFGEGVIAMGCDSISKYEMHFFKAMYNLAPYKLNKFAAPVVTEVRDKNAGLYFNAYMSYAKYLGPDSTKNMMISTHIDKRWDSIAFMPELDFDFMKQEMMKMHKALIYALLYGAIKQRTLSSAAGGKKIFRYENSDERIVDLTVSNGTLCDEFYEIVDALYIDASVVEDIGKLYEENHIRDQVRCANYDKTFFANSVQEFTLPSVHDGIASLFEIPLAYHNSLPNNRCFTSEIVGMVDAVVETFSDELHMSENADDVRFMLCEILKEQFDLFMKNYNEFEVLNMGKPAQDNVVIDTVFRKIRHVFNESPEPDDCDAMLKDMKALIR